MYSKPKLNPSSPMRAILASAAAVLCLGGLTTVPAHATTTDGGGGEAVSPSAMDVGAMVAMRKAQMAHDYVANAAARQTQD